MILHISPTPFTTQMNHVRVRLWWGHNDKGQSFTVWIAAVGSGDPLAQTWLEATLTEIQAPLTFEQLEALAKHVEEMKEAFR